jgi:hypothetical protein
MHGTAVAGIAAGDGAASGYRDRKRLANPMDDSLDNQGWYLGTGVAPTAGILVTKAMASSQFDATEADLVRWIDDAVSVYDAGGNQSPRSPIVTVQNHSFAFGATPDPSGRYSCVSRAYDLAVRDANGPGNGRPEILISVAAGNSAGNSSINNYVSTGAMAKNVLVVSGTENWRQWLAGDSYGCLAGGGFRNIMAISRMGTFTPGYLKPDVMAPASQIVSTFTTIRTQMDINGSTLCPPWVRGYYDAEPFEEDADKNEYVSLRKGTSYAAPVGAGAALIVKRYLGAAPESTSPALAKAMLIAGAQSIRGGEDHTVHPDFPGSAISSVPSEQQGFGRLSFDDILTGTTKPVFQDQDPGLIFTTSGAWKHARVRVRDSEKPIKVVLVWSDAAFNPTESNPYVTPLVNDLNLEVRPVTGASVVYLGNRMSVSEESVPYPPQGPFDPDDVNNVEYARFFAAPNQEFEVTVRSPRISGDTNGDRENFEQDFAIVIINAVQTSPFTPYFLPAPSVRPIVQAVGTGSTVSISWTEVPGATSYVVQRKTSALPWQDVSPPLTVFVTADAPSSATGVVLYRVIATTDAGQITSAPDVAFVGAFTDGTNVVIPPLTPVRAVHITEIRRAVNALCEIGGLAPVYSAADVDPSILRGQTVASFSWTSLMAKLSSTRVAVGLPTGWTFRFPTPAPDPGRVIHRTHIEDLRRGFQ